MLYFYSQVTRGTCKIQTLYVQIFRQTEPDCPQNSYIINLYNHLQLVIESEVYYLQIKAGKQY